MSQMGKFMTLSNPPCKQVYKFKLSKNKTMEYQRIGPKLIFEEFICYHHVCMFTKA